mgnify:CR=1 FL=1
MKKTEELLKTIQSCKNYQDFISESRQELISVRKLGEAFQEILTQKKLKKSDPNVDLKLRDYRPWICL